MKSIGSCFSPLFHGGVINGPKEMYPCGSKNYVSLGFLSRPGVRATINMASIAGGSVVRYGRGRVGMLRNNLAALDCSRSTRACEAYI